MNEEFSGLVDHLQDHAGDALQAVVVYLGDDHRDLYRREDVVELHGSELDAEVLADIRSDKRRRESEAAKAYEGSLRATVRVFDYRVVLNLPRDDESGTVVVLDVSAASDLADFVTDIRADIYDG
ncbi:hypothetical protein [Halobacterium rubrum]|uniref:hypothetical protein n=1 Tax=Halobacterium TaxID=2239 RepID=UPI001F21C7D2|nr:MULTISPECIES: hypothetical protein [Halobacterium]MDH5020326.1 hypothetical protein [Halobacterium rubrum]